MKRDLSSPLAVTPNPGDKPKKKKKRTVGKKKRPRINPKTGRISVGGKDISEFKRFIAAKEKRDKKNI